MQILAAAVRVFGAGGPSAVTHRAVAAEAGVSTGLTTYYFKDRDDLLYQALTYAFEVEAERLQECVRDCDHELTVDETIDLLTEMFFDKTVADPLYDIALFEMFLEATRNPPVRVLTREWSALIFRLVDQVLPPTDPSVPRETVVQIVAAQIDGLMLEETSNQALGLDGLSAHLRMVIERFLR
ncbi:transcriptional regulator, TetR family [Actinomyces ruminicola]|uniref:Transcriptional regulator, TetR family n=1 Tax=Actinomyces ruminicola TaxID=332524 RepID=A0A1G9W8Q1_9ACTO|nr:transcriptional regulator, TetR family [Actinomyces ruminicola]